MFFTLGTAHLVITDSGLGGLSVCADLERRLAASGSPGDVRITYVNAWPEPGRGYNDFPDIAARARVFDRVLRRIAGLRPDILVIACNTLSIVYDHTEFRRAPAFPVRGIVDAGVDLFHEALSRSPRSAIVLLGTRTTIEADVHRLKLIERGIPASRIGAASCHGLATAIERGPDSDLTAASIDRCAAAAADAAAEGDPLYAGLCCTHYGLAGSRLGAAIARQAERAVEVLDPNTRLSGAVAADFAGPGGEARDGRIAVTVISKVPLTADQRSAVGDLLRPMSQATADALRHYTHDPELF